MSKLQERLTERVKEINGGNHQDTMGYDDQVAAGPIPAGDASDGNDGKFLQVSVVPQFAVSLQEAKERIQMLRQFVKEYMVPNEDYGLIPGCQRPSLFKPGAEKLCDVYGFSKHVEITGKTENWDEPFLNYEIKVTLLNKRTGFIEAEGIGNANSKEKKFAKQDTFSVSNTLLKVAKKRALVDAVLSATRSSGLFTQDVEDLVIDRTDLGREKQPQEAAASATSSKDKEFVTEEQITTIYTLARELNFSPGVGKKILINHYGAEKVQQLTQVQGDDLIRRLRELKNKETR